MLRKALMRRSEGRRSRHEELVININSLQWYAGFYSEFERRTHFQVHTSWILIYYSRFLILFSPSVDFGATVDHFRDLKSYSYSRNITAEFNILSKTGLGIKFC
jgi:hypothetical protein